MTTREKYPLIIRCKDICSDTIYIITKHKKEEYAENDDHRKDLYVVREFPARMKYCKECEKACGRHNGVGTMGWRYNSKAKAFDHIERMPEIKRTCAEMSKARHSKPTDSLMDKGPELRIRYIRDLETYTGRKVSEKDILDFEEDMYEEIYRMRKYRWDAGDTFPGEIGLDGEIFIHPYKVGVDGGTGIPMNPYNIR